jgi:hypothetical protein
MDYEYGMRPATNRMAMARGAKYMKVHNLPGWYNTGGNLFGATRVRPVLNANERAARRKPKTSIRPSSPASVFNFPNVNVNAGGTNKWTVPRQSAVKMYNKRSLMTKITGSIGLNSKGMGWAKVKGNFVPLIGTRSKGGGYVVNMKGMNKPAKYDDVVKGIHSFRI